MNILDAVIGFERVPDDVNESYTVWYSDQQAEINSEQFTESFHFDESFNFFSGSVGFEMVTIHPVLQMLMKAIRSKSLLLQH